MPKFDCEVKNAKGEVLKTQIEAESMAKLASMLSDKGFYLIKATAVKEGGGFSLSFGGSVSAKELMVFTVQLSTLISASIPLVDSVGIMFDQAENPYFKDVLDKVGKDLRSGQPFSAALRKHPKVFNNIFCNMVEAGEAGGILDKVLARLAAFAEADSKMRGKIKGALTMPVVQLVLAVGCVIFLLVKIFPNFTKMFKKMKAELPVLTKTMIWASDMLLEQYILVLAVTGGIGLGFYMFMKTELGEAIIARLAISAPIVGPITKKIAVSRFARTFCSLLGSGVPILNALKITGSVMGNKVLEDLVGQMAVSVQQGKGLSSSIKGNPIFPTMVQKMMEVGENSGNLDKMLEKVADFYDQETAEALDGLTGALLPILTVFMGVMIGGIALSVFMPLFSIVQQMK
ncbi:MAG TPA: type II secretion system F family protein [Candidatus Ozemobacteraceae bacterium]|nr:type II secretion system F family protein [Candidatus Ozemobacteraceae bacterium]